MNLLSSLSNSDEFKPTSGILIVLLTMGFTLLCSFKLLLLSGVGDCAVVLHESWIWKKISTWHKFLIGKNIDEIDEYLVIYQNDSYQIFLLAS